MTIRKDNERFLFADYDCSEAYPPKMTLEEGHHVSCWLCKKKQMRKMGTNSLLKIDGFKRYFPITKGLMIQRVTGYVKVVDHISFSVNEDDGITTPGRP